MIIIPDHPNQPTFVRLREWRVVQSGSTDRMAAGQAKFKTRHLAGIEETRQARGLDYGA